jgi:hypothetical protein
MKINESKLGKHKNAVFFDLRSKVINVSGEID